ncbi:MAG: ABC transporter ATP-binding protein [Paracoccaceae bacterium]
MPALEAHELYRFFHVADTETAALRGVSLSLAPGEIVAVTGPSGSGKSTLLNCLTGLDTPDAGHVDIAGTRMTRRPEAERAHMRASNFGILMQSGNLFEHFTVAANVDFQLRLLGRRDPARVEQLLQSVGLEHRAGARPTQLSGGETARAGLAVALSGDPSILIADEPTAEVDEDTEALLMEHFESRRRRGLSTLIATHSEALSRRAGRVIRLQDGRCLDA